MHSLNKRNPNLGINNLLQNPVLWIAILFIIRLWNINIGPLDSHAWRQSITLGVARNYLNWDPSFFTPRTILCDSRGGELAQEFPLYNYLVYLGWSIFGEQNWVFRITNLIISSLGLFWFYKSITLIFDNRKALFSMILFGTSIAFIYARKGMPDTVSVSLAFGGLYYGIRYLSLKSSKPFGKEIFLYFMLVTLGVLCKISALTVMTFISIPFIFGSITLNKRLFFLLANILALTIIFYWYFIWVEDTEKNFGFLLFYPKSLSVGFNEITNSNGQTFGRFELIAFQNYYTFYICCVGLLISFCTKARIKSLTLTVITAIIFFYFMVKTGFVFSSHEYYVIPFIPFMSLYGAFAIDFTIKNTSTLFSVPIILIISSIGIYPQLKDFHISKNLKKFESLEQLVDNHIPKNSRVLTSAHDGNPMMLYQANRIGWSDDVRWKDAKWVKDEHTVGLDFLIIEKSRYDVEIPFRKIAENDHFLIFLVE